MTTLIIINAAIMTMDEALPTAEAIAVSGNRIIRLGSHAEVMREAGVNTRVVDAGGGTVIPGFVEGHMHLFAGAAELSHLQLFGTRGFDELKARTEAYMRQNPGDDLIIGEQADYVIIGEHEPLSRQHLDRIVKDRPILLFSPDHHTAWANTLALEKAGLLKGKKLGPGNEIVMGADGLAQGELREGEAIDPVRRLSQKGTRDRLGLATGGEPDPYPTAAEFESDLETMRVGLRHCAAHGITFIQNMDGNLYTLELLEELQRRGELTARVRAPFHFKNFMDIAMLEKASQMAARWTGDMLCSGFVKLFMDGVADSATAVMIEDYASRPGWKGEPLFEPARFAAIATEADRRGLQIAVHAIGDGAVRIVLDGYEAALKANGRCDSRHRVEHVEVIHPDDIARFAKLGVIASMQPPHPPGNHGLPLEPYLSNIGEARWQWAFAWKALREQGARLVFGTDWPVSDIDPLWSVQSAMTRGRWNGAMPDNRQSLHQAIHSYTADGAFAGFMEGKTGVLRQGMLADICVLPVNLQRMDPSSFKGIKPRMTVCDGRVVFGG
ncbi:MAG: amidohydrolase [Aestuariivirga sp.]|uniref:amidohydrolase n=1 Tax=Aestuariivirga sp. TaxID=2650926 RepID=UPI0025BCC89F|nr:amidohydrolase [Aestuariivirga sp.]MCA3560429.1 amidohydrolase [Aestuariivirga sp.]